MLPLSRPGFPITGLFGHRIYAGCAVGHVKEMEAEIVAGKPVARNQVSPM
jgi:hypothetical protein